MQKNSNDNIFCNICSNKNVVEAIYAVAAEHKQQKYI